MVSNSRKLQLGGTREICQVCIVVNDLEVSAKKYTELFRAPVPPITTMTERARKLSTNRGKQMTGGMSQVCFYFRKYYGFELICPDEGPSFWRENLDRFGDGVNHIAYGIRNMDEIRQLQGEVKIMIETQGI